MTASDLVQAITNAGVSERLDCPRKTISLILVLVALLIAAAYLSPEIWHHGEAREALVVQDIVGNARWVLPLRNGELPSKPILYHWIAASLSLLVGLSDFTIRLPSVIGAAIMVWITYVLGTLNSNRKIGLLAVGILGSTFEFWDSGTEARVDMLFAALIGVALAAWYLWYRSGREFARATAYLAIAFAVLVKGPAGAALPALVIICFLLAERQFGKLFAFFSWPWVVTVLVIDMGWYLVAYQRGGAEFWYKQIIYENLQRFFGAGEFEKQKNSFSQAIWFVTQLFPWSLVVLWAFLRRFRARRKSSFECFLHTWWLAIFGFFLLASGERAVYLLPIYPAVALLVARELMALTDSQTAFNWKAAAVIIIVATNLSMAVSVPISRVVKEDRSEQENFVEEIVAELPRTAKLYAAPEFPEPLLTILAYRLSRNIQRRTPVCAGEYYYLNNGTPLPACWKSTPVLASLRDRKLHLLHLWNSSVRNKTLHLAVH